MSKSDCKHMIFSSNIRVGRLTESDESDKVVGYTFEAKVICAQCKQPFEFIGLFAGVSDSSPMVSIDMTELRAPIQPHTGKVLTEARYGVKGSPNPPSPTKNN